MVQARRTLKAGTLTAGEAVSGRATRRRRAGACVSLPRPGEADWLLLYTVAGCGEAEGPGLRRALGAGSALLVGPGQSVQCRALGTPAWHWLAVRFRPRPHWRAWLAWPERRQGWAWLQVDAPALRARVLRHLRQCVAWGRRDGPGATQHLLAEFEHVLLELDTLNPRAGAHPLDARVARAQEWLSRHLDEPMALAAVARAAGVSVPRLCGLFREQVKRSPMRYLEDLRLERAAALLHAGELSVKQVAAATGFSSPFYFSLRFKRHTGHSPRTWRTRAE